MFIWLSISNFILCVICISGVVLYTDLFTYIVSILAWFYRRVQSSQLAAIVIVNDLLTHLLTLFMSIFVQGLSRSEYFIHANWYEPNKATVRFEFFV